MLLSLNWIKQYVKLPKVSPQDLALAITMSTVEVEKYYDQAQHLDGVVVGKVTEVVKHPKADRLWVCNVDIKSKQLQVICGGTNVSKGMLVAIATVGSTIRWHGEGELISLTNVKIRGIESNGMIAASNEIGLQKLFPATDREILDLSPYQVRVGDPLSKALGLEDVVYEIDNKSMTHRPDLWGQYGMAREVAAIYNTKLKPLGLPELPKGTEKKKLTVEVRNDALCSRYAALVLDQVTVGPSPWWLKRDLEALGMNSVNNIVDATNYVMMSLGQPVHAFDYDHIADHKIVIDRAGPRVRIAALNEKTYHITADTLMIKDGKKNIAIAGIIGASNSHVTDTTKTVVIEVANFAATAIRRTSVSLGLRTEASTRFEKTLDQEFVPLAMQMVVDLLRKVSPDVTVASKLIDKRLSPPHHKTIVLTHVLLEKRLGKHIDPKIVTSILTRLEFGAQYKKEQHEVVVPSFRGHDISLPEDVIEEVARIYGYNEIEPVMPYSEISAPSRGLTSRIERELKSILTRGFGYSEVSNNSFSDIQWSERLSLDRGRLTLKNALSPEQKYLRNSLIPGLLRLTVENLRWYDEFRIFELGRIFLKTPGEYVVGGTSNDFLPMQPRMVSGVGLSSTTEPEVLYQEVRGMLESILKVLKIEVSMQETKLPAYAALGLEIRSHNAIIGHIGFLKPDSGTEDIRDKALVWWDLQFESLVKYADFSRTFVPLSKFPAMRRDVAISIDTNTRWADIEHALKNISPLVTRIEVFDVFVSPKLGVDKKSIAFRLTFKSDDRTLEATEVDQIVSLIHTTLQREFNAVIR